jgi:hypothetical protein
MASPTPSAAKPSILIIGGLGTSPFPQIITIPQPKPRRFHRPAPRPPHLHALPLIPLPPRRQSPPPTRTPLCRTPPPLLRSALPPGRRLQPGFPPAHLRPSSRHTPRFQLGLHHQPRRRDRLVAVPRGLRCTDYTVIARPGGGGEAWM